MIVFMLFDISSVRPCAPVITFYNLSVSDVRMCAEDESFRSRVNDYIQDNIDAVMNSKNFFSLPRIQLEVIGKGASI